MSLAAPRATQKWPGHPSAKSASPPGTGRFRGRALPYTTTTFLLFNWHIIDLVTWHWRRSSLWLSCRTGQWSCYPSSSLWWNRGLRNYRSGGTRICLLVSFCESLPPSASSVGYNSVSSPEVSSESFGSLLLFWPVHVCAPPCSDSSSAAQLAPVILLSSHWRWRRPCMSADRVVERSHLLSTKGDYQQNWLRTKCPSAFTEYLSSFQGVFYFPFQFQYIAL